MTFEEVLDFLEKLESGELEKTCSPEDLEKIKEFLIFLARQGMLPNDPEAEKQLEEDILELFQEEDSLYDFELSYNDGDYEIVPTIFYGQRNCIPCGWASKNWKRAKKFIRKHKKEIIIGGVIIVAAVVVTVAVATAASAEAATTAAAGAASALGSLNAKEEEPYESPKKPEELLNDNPAKETAATEIASYETLLKETLETQITAFKDSAKEDLNIDESSQNSSFLDAIRNMGSNMAHQTLDAVDELGSIIPMVLDAIGQSGKKLLPENFISEEELGSPLENYERIMAKGHQMIDQIFHTDQANLYTPEAKACNPFDYAVLPPPDEVLAPLLKNAGKVTKAANEASKINTTEEAALAARNIREIENSGLAQEKMGNILESFSEEARIRSIEKFERAREFLKPYKGQYMSEMEAKELIQRAGIQTFPRPAGIPKNFRIRLSSKNAGIIYVHPEHTHTSIRIMPGKPYSPFPFQRNPYVIHKINGRTLNKFGNEVLSNSPEAHISLKEFVYRNK
ncbi:MAG: hypothetical protein Tsb0015_17530 [Simkaniaceae bacterium]